jgi:hypothetical protein
LPETTTILINEVLLYNLVMAFDDFRHYVTFHSICDTIQNKRELSENSRVYFKWAQEFFSDISKSLDSMLNPPKEGGYYFMEPSIKEVFANYGEDITKMSGQKIHEMKQNFQEISNNLEKLELDSATFYKTPQAEKTLSVLRKMLPKDFGFSAYDLFGDIGGD